MALKESKHHKSEISFDASGASCVRLVWPRTVTNEQREFIASQKHEIVVRFTREDVEGGSEAAVLERLEHLSVNAACVVRFAMRVRFEFGGYEEDPREPHEIPSCINFVRRINAHWPYWLHFAVKRLDHIEPLLLLLAAVCELDCQSGRAPSRDEDAREIDDVVMAGGLVHLRTLKEVVNRGHLAEVWLRGSRGMDPSLADRTRRSVMSVVECAHQWQVMMHPPPRVVITKAPKNQASKLRDQSGA